MSPGARRSAARIAFFAFAALLVVGTHWPALRVPEVGGFTRMDLLVHAGAFGVWTGLLILCGFFGPALSGRNILLCAVVGAAYASIDEGTQAIPWFNRYVGWDDWAMNLIGVALACIAGAAMSRVRRYAAPRATAPATEQAAAHDRAHRGVFAAVRVVAGLTLVSRTGGLFRDMATARVLGDTAVGSAFGFAFLIPNLFRRLFGEGALSAAFIPIYTELHRDEAEKAPRFASLTVLFLTILTMAITVVGEVVLLGVLVWTPENPDRDLAIRLSMILLPYMPLVCVTALMGGMLQVHGRFAPAAGASIILNVIIIAGAIAAAALRVDTVIASYVLAAAALASGFGQLAWCLWALRRFVRWTRVFGGVQDSARLMIKRFLPGALGLGALQLNTMMDGLIASWPILVGPTILGVLYPLDESSNAVLSYTQRLYQFPLGVFGIAIATAIFPALSRASSDAPLFAAMIRRGIRLSLFIGLPASMGLMIVRRDLCAVVFEGGNFSAEGVGRSAFILLGYAGAVWAYSVNHTLVRGFYAQGDTRTPVKISIATVALNLAGNLTLIWIPGVGEAGLAWSTAISSTAQCVMLGATLRSRMPGRRLLLREDGAAIARIAAAALGMAVPTALAAWLIPIDGTWAGRLVRLAACLAVGMAAYGGLALALRAPELRWLLSRRAGPADGGVSRPS